MARRKGGRRRAAGAGRWRTRLRWLLLSVTLLQVAAGCAQFGVPAVPPAMGEPPWAADGVYLSYDAHTVLGFGHVGVIVPAAEPARWLRFDQYASAELEYGERARAGTAHFWEPLTSRLPSIFGLTREVVVRYAGPSPGSLRVAGEVLLRVRGLDAAAVRQAAEARFAAASQRETPTAPRYGWTFNNCQHFVRDVLRAGGPIPERYFPKHLVAAYLERERQR